LCGEKIEGANGRPGRQSLSLISDGRIIELHEEYRQRLVEAFRAKIKQMEDLMASSLLLSTGFPMPLFSTSPIWRRGQTITQAHDIADSLGLFQLTVEAGRSNRNNGDWNSHTLRGVL
jgi:hypothetical protein